MAAIEEHKPAEKRRALGRGLDSLLPSGPRVVSSGAATAVASDPTTAISYCSPPTMGPFTTGMHPTRRRSSSPPSATSWIASPISAVLWSAVSKRCI